MSIDSALNLNLPVVPLTANKELAGELQIVYNALNIILQALNDAGIPSGGSTPAPGTLAVVNGGTGVNAISGILIGNGVANFSSITPAAGVESFLQTPSSANLRAALTDETGSGAAVFASIPLLITPRLTGYTVATLPAGTVGMCAYVTDALAPAWNAAVVGGGAITVRVFYNGAAWISF